MKTVYEQRASTIIHNLLLSGNFGREYVYLVPANICPIVVFTIKGTGTDVEFIDIDASTLCMDHAQILERLTDTSKKTVAGVFYVRTYGFMNDVTSFFSRLKSSYPDLLLVDDRCMARPEPDYKKSNSMDADVVLFSTGYGKYVDLEFGGFAHLEDGLHYESRYDVFIKESLDLITELYKRHISDGTQIEDSEYIDNLSHWLDTTRPTITWNQYRNAIVEERSRADKIKSGHNKIYRKIIPLSVCMNHNYQDWRFQIRVRNKPELIRKIENSGLFTSGHYYPSSSLFAQKIYPQACKLYENIVNLFNDRYVTQEQVKEIAMIVFDHIHNDTSKI